MENENTYVAQLQQAQHEDRKRQRGNEQQRKMQEASENPDWRPENSGGENKKYKISTVVGLLMIIVALLVDGVSFLLGIFVILEPINWIVWICAVLGFYVWLKMVGMSWNDAKGKRTLMMFGGATGIEFIPYVNMLPAWTAFVIWAIVNDRIEGVLKSSPMAQKATGVMQKRKEEQEKKEKEEKEKK